MEQQGCGTRLADERGMLPRVSKRFSQFGLVSLMSLLVLSWSTCPSLYVNSVRTLVGAQVHACACNDAEPTCLSCEQSDCEQGDCQQRDCQQEGPATPENGAPKRCPLCKTIGSMHALVTLDAPVALAAPVLTTELVVVTLAPAPSVRVTARLEQIVSPPDEQFTTTVRFLC